LELAGCDVIDPPPDLILLFAGDAVASIVECAKLDF
jgi:hypothetical protein